MTLRGILAVVFVLALVAFFVFASRSGERMLAARKARFEAARPVRARVVATRQGNGALVVNGRRGPEIVLTLEIEGRALEVPWYVFELGLARIQAGAEIPVRVDAVDPTVVFPDAEWAELSTTIWAKLA